MAKKKLTNADVEAREQMRLDAERTRRLAEKAELDERKKRAS
jgi:hypothetical protein